MSTRNPDWLPEVRDLCRRSSFVISGWGADTLIVEAKSDARADEAASLLRQFGFTAMPRDEDKEAGLLMLSRNPTATQAKQSSFDTSRRPLNERIVPAFEAALSIGLFWYGIAVTPSASWRFASYAAIILVVTVWDFSRTSGWRLQTSAEELRIRRYFRWNVIPWSQIRSLGTAPVRSRGNNREILNLTLASGARFRLGVFGYPFARALCDRLRSELAQRHPSKP